MAKQQDNPLFGPSKSSFQQKMRGNSSKGMDDSEEEKEEGDTSGSKCGCIEELLEAQQALRMQHWLTKSFAQHKAIGKAYEELDELIDTFVETLIGAKSRDVLSGITSLAVGGDAKKILDDLEDCLKNEIPKEVGEDATGLLAIRDDMLNLVDRTRYLLTLE
jgi:hypothetical protein